MKVLFATYPMAFHTPGGGEVQLLAYKKHLPAYGVDISFFDPWKPDFLGHDVVHFFSCVGGSSHFCTFVKRLGMPLVISSSLWITEETKHLYPVDEIRLQLSLADRVITNSNIECNTLARVLDLPREKFVTVYNGVEPIFFEPVSPKSFRDQFGINERFILNVGNIEPRKNQLKLVQVMKALPDLKLVLIGHARDPDYTAEVLAIGGEQVRYIGPLPHESELLRSAYAACEVFCLPSALETPGLAALEAHAAGCSIVVTKVGSTQEYFRDSVVYVDPEYTEEILVALQQALKTNKESQLLKLQNRTDRFFWHTMVSPLVNTYKDVVVL
jgi:glycosyltransferase involved in cell wall biosynthesis